MARLDRFSRFLPKDKRAQIQELLEPHKRILILGASGWFGQTASRMLSDLDSELLCVVRNISAASNSLPLVKFIEWDERKVSDFAPSLVLDFSFLTKDRASEMHLSEFEYANRALTERLLNLVRKPFVRSLVYVSSGAAVYPEDALGRANSESLYGLLKREAEMGLISALQEEGGGKELTILRAWSVTGPFLSNPNKYLFSSLINQAISGKIRIESDNEVWRKYVSISDALILALWNLGQSQGPILETGGELIEARELALMVQEIVNPLAILDLNPPRKEGKDEYFSQGTSWEAAVQAVAYRVTPTEDQIRLTSDYLRDRR